MTRDCHYIADKNDTQLIEGIRRVILKMLVRMVPVVLLACMIAGCDVGEKSSTVKGKTIDKTSQLPIDSAWVNTIDTTDGARYSNAEGLFSLTTFGEIQKFYAGKEGYETRLIELSDDARDHENVLVELVRSQSSQ